MDAVDKCLEAFSKEVPVRKHLLEQAIIFIDTAEANFDRSWVTPRSAAKQARLGAIKVMLRRVMNEEQEEVKQLQESASIGGGVE